MKQTDAIRPTGIDDWINTLRHGAHWGSHMDTVARATLTAMATSDDEYTGGDLYRVFASPAQRHRFLENVRDKRVTDVQSALRRLSAAHESTYTLLARRAEKTLGKVSH
jgi:hypothetical protein